MVGSIEAGDVLLEARETERFISLPLDDLHLNLSMATSCFHRSLILLPHYEALFSMRSLQFRHIVLNSAKATASSPRNPSCFSLRDRTYSVNTPKLTFTRMRHTILSSNPRSISIESECSNETVRDHLPSQRRHSPLQRYMLQCDLNSLVTLHRKWLSLRQTWSWYCVQQALYC